MSDAKFRELGRYLNKNREDYPKWLEYLALASRIGELEPTKYRSYLFLVATTLGTQDLPEAYAYKLLYNMRNSVGQQLSASQLGQLFNLVLPELYQLPPTVEWNENFKEDEPGVSVDGYSIWYNDTHKVVKNDRKWLAEPRNVLDTTPQYLLMAEKHYPASGYNPPDWDLVEIAVDSDPSKIIVSYILDKENTENYDALYDANYEYDENYQPTLEQLVNLASKQLKEIFNKFINPPEVVTQRTRIVVVDDGFVADWFFAQKYITYSFGPFTDPKKKNSKDFEKNLNNVLEPFDTIWKTWLTERLNTIFKKLEQKRANPSNDEIRQRKLREARTEKDYKKLNEAKLALWRTAGEIEPDFVEEYQGRIDLFPNQGVATKKHPGSEIRIWNLGNEDKLIITAERRRRSYPRDNYYWNVDAVRQFLIPERNLVDEHSLFEWEYVDSPKPNWNHHKLQEAIRKEIESSLSRRRNPDESSRRKEREGLASAGKLSAEAKLAMWRSGQVVPPDKCGEFDLRKISNKGFIKAYYGSTEETDFKKPSCTWIFNKREITIYLDGKEETRWVFHYVRYEPIINELIESVFPILVPRNPSDENIPWDHEILQVKLFEMFTTYFLEEGDWNNLRKNPRGDERLRKVERNEIPGDPKLEAWRRGFVVPPNYSEEERLTERAWGDIAIWLKPGFKYIEGEGSHGRWIHVHSVMLTATKTRIYEVVVPAPHFKILRYQTSHPHGGADTGSEPDWEDPELQKLIFQAYITSDTPPRENPDENSRRKERDALASQGKLSDPAKIALWRSGQPAPPDFPPGPDKMGSGAWELENRTVVLYYRVDDYSVTQNVIRITADLFYKGYLLKNYLPILEIEVRVLKEGEKAESRISWDHPVVQEKIFEYLTDTIYQDDEDLVDRELQDRSKQGNSKRNPDENSRRKERKSLASEGKLSDEAKLAMWRSGQMPPPDLVKEEERSLTRGTSQHEGSETREWSLGGKTVIVWADRMEFVRGNENCQTCFGIGTIHSEYPDYDEDCPDCGNVSTEWVFQGSWYNTGNPDYKWNAFNALYYSDSELPPWNDEQLQEHIYKALFDRRNPLNITDYMKEWRIDNKANVVVKMPAMTFLKLTTESDESLGDIINEARSLAEYNDYAKTKDMSPIFLDILLDRKEKTGVIIGHNGRHRASSMLNNGESDVEVTLRFINPQTGYSRNYTILDMPIFIHPQFPELGRDYILDAFQDITEVVETNVQHQSQKKSPIENKSLSAVEFRKLLRKILSS